MTKVQTFEEELKDVKKQLDEATELLSILFSRYATCEDMESISDEEIKVRLYEWHDKRIKYDYDKLVKVIDLLSFVDLRQVLARADRLLAGG